MYIHVINNYTKKGLGMHINGVVPFRLIPFRSNFFKVLFMDTIWIRQLEK